MIGYAAKSRIFRSGCRFGLAMVIAGLFAIASYSNPVVADPLVVSTLQK